MPAQILSPRGDSPRGGSPRGGSPRRAQSPSRERMIQQEYWKEHTSTLDGATVEAMMLDSQVILTFTFACLSGDSMQGAKGIFQSAYNRRGA